MPTEQFLDNAYDLDKTEDTRAFYDDWAKTYDAEVAENGYVTPGRCAEALRAIDDTLSTPVIDLGCGTGLSGVALRAEGFDVVDGVDLSEEMLSVAKARNCYRTLSTIDLASPLDALVEGVDQPYAHAVAMGVLNPGHAPAETILHALNILPAGGALVFSLNDHALADRTYEARINDVVDGGLAEVVFKEYGPHLPARELNAMVYGLKKR